MLSCFQVLGWRVQNEYAKDDSTFARSVNMLVNVKTPVTTTESSPLGMLFYMGTNKVIMVWHLKFLPPKIYACLTYILQCFLKCFVDFQYVKKSISKKLWRLVFHNLYFHILHFSQCGQFSGFFAIQFFLASIFIYHLFIGRIMHESRSLYRTFLRASELWWKRTTPDFFLPENFFGSVPSCCKKGSWGGFFLIDFSDENKAQMQHYIWEPFIDKKG